MQLDNPARLVQQYRPLNPEVEEEVKKLLKTPEVQMYFCKHIISVMVENGVDFDNNTQKDGPIFIKGLNRGVLLFIESMNSELYEGE